MTTFPARDEPAGDRRRTWSSRGSSPTSREFLLDGRPATGVSSSSKKRSHLNSHSCTRFPSKLGNSTLVWRVTLSLDQLVHFVICLCGSTPSSPNSSSMFPLSRGLFSTAISLLSNTSNFRKISCNILDILSISVWLLFDRVPSAIVM